MDPDQRQVVLFRAAVQALDSGDVPRLAALLEAHPALGLHRCRTGVPYEEGYFAGATLLQHLAGNPDRGPLPANVLDAARLLLRHAFDPRAAQDTVELLLTSRRAAEAGVALPLIDLPVSAGARLDLEAPETLGKPLLNMAPSTAEALLQRGARMDVRHAAALGDVAALEGMLAGAIEPAMLEEALAYACVGGQAEAAALLSGRGARGDVLVAPGGATPRTALHEAANRGHLAILTILLDAGADPTVVEPAWGGTAAGWAEHGGHAGAVALLGRHRSSRR
jgi:hypothetical protein